MKRRETLRVIPLAPLGRVKLLSEDVRNRRLALALYLMGPPEGIGFYLVNSLFRVHLRPVRLQNPMTVEENQEEAE